MRFVITVILLSITLFINCSNVLAKDESVGIRIDMLPWGKVDGVLPKYSEFTVLDVETGKMFKVQRRAGNRHADVQPLTSKDTKIMKEIYGGKWSWKRRAIIVIQYDQWIAASMHGMPHGAGALENDFPGHFCIHFYGSKTHRTNSIDLSHKLMILKAAGKLQEYVTSADPFELINAYVAGFKQQDSRIISTISLQQIDWKEHIQSVENINLKRMSVFPVEDLVNKISLEVPVEIQWVSNNSEIKYFKGNIYLFRFSPADAWKIDSIRFLKDSRILKEFKNRKENTFWSNY
ncbi:hypothetical protein [Peribacillus loiseleuriae]|uniref:Uncharacterized protein n=1 Tax=Peribacillus loiseleuriae TaxID=1679170 RepID=A0A0K9G7J0_9BACI|nr:hypothetical protein [Peribacillus loiseleuriae]KMY42795.1 hypothetical protein AC625_24405 [Peribacillus loiseleuriae]